MVILSLICSLGSFVSWASAMHGRFGMGRRNDQPVGQSREAIATSRDLLRLAKNNITAAAARIEHARNLLQAVWLQREMLRRRLRS